MGANQSCGIKRRHLVILWPVEIGGGGRFGGERGPIGVPVAVQAVDPQREHVFRVLDEPPGAGELQALLRDIAMRAFDFSGADRKPFGEGLAIFQLVLAGTEITMADADRGLVVAHIGRFAVGSQGAENLVDAPCLQRVLLRLHPGFPGGCLPRTRSGASGAIVFAAALKYSQT